MKHGNRQINYQGLFRPECAESSDLYILLSRSVSSGNAAARKESVRVTLEQIPTDFPDSDLPYSRFRH
jgi:hypothetical protein